jgi:uncharacterized BrkB/YihY/UPF0761 family membrane protein
VLNAAAATFVTHADVSYAIRVPALLGMVVLNVALYFAVFRVTTPGRVESRNLWPGSLLASLGFTVLITLGSE